MSTAGTPVPVRGVPGPADLRRHLLFDRQERAVSLHLGGRVPLAVAALAERAEVAVAAPGWSVTDSAFVPPGASPNEYVHIAEYAWPDERDPSLPWVLRDGRANPVARQIASDGRRLAELAAGVDVLGLATALVGEDRYREAADRLLRRWFIDPATSMHPSLRFAVCVPGRVAPMDWGLARLHPLLGVLDAVTLLDGGGALEATAVGVSAWASDLLDWLLPSDLLRAELARGNNHSTQAIALALGLAIHTGDPRAHELARTAADVVRDQVDEHGSQPAEMERSRSYYYCGYNLLGMLRVAELAWCCGVDLFGADDAPRRALESLLPALVDPRRWPHRSVERSDDRRHGELLVRAAATWPGNERIARALCDSRICPGPAHLVWLEVGLDPSVADRSGPR